MTHRKIEKPIHKGLLSITVVTIGLIFSNVSMAQIREDERATSEKLDELKKQIEISTERTKSLEQEAAQVREEIADIQQQLINSAADIQKTESNITRGEQNLAELLIREKELEEKLSDRNFEMASTLGAMQRLSMQSTNVVAFKPDEAINTLRTTSLLKVVLPDLKSRADVLENDLSELNVVRHDISRQNELLKQQLAALVISNGEIDELLKQRQVRQSVLEKTTREEQEKLKQFAENAKDLQELIDQIETEIALREEAARRAAKISRDRPAPAGSTTSVARLSTPDPSSNFAGSKGNLPLPASGSIGQSFNQLLPSGQRAKGITIDTRVGATVIAPHEGRIVYAGKFRTYGQLLIISHGDGYHTLLAGLENINSNVGQWVLKGEPVGQMSREAGPSNSRQKLYVELRQQGKPVNPLPWIIAMDRQGK
ncbi:murein hydrolase activator EnvC family protein [Pseudemcibacter aquimaris]|uniref:murein hydrolase activator EnvC family protein n=1 Tax=Pseudemcibacter aquimaris TaxID=2857064 RepID=UPI00201291C9|nr:peptidoglycan DD-metalloendopeptidase family protein [Pseudemcibacter aquimaris]MCC3861637.1 peptidoglycan DD-metalloendopeptidase family protein [Pseudemcibacter aquimaris]WDU58408.1 peptidoglycan DD-metalloendopeptidase family protein [Pseudemcibacter aquimaris]